MFMTTIPTESSISSTNEIEINFNYHKINKTNNFNYTTASGKDVKNYINNEFNLDNNYTLTINNLEIINDIFDTFTLNYLFQLYNIPINTINNINIQICDISEVNSNNTHEVLKDIQEDTASKEYEFNDLNSAYINNTKKIEEIQNIKTKLKNYGADLREDYNKQNGVGFANKKVEESNDINTNVNNVQNKKIEYDDGKKVVDAYLEKIIINKGKEREAINGINDNKVLVGRGYWGKVEMRQKEKELEELNQMKSEMNEKKKESNGYIIDTYLRSKK